MNGFIKSRRVTPPRRSIAYLKDCFVLLNAAVVTASGNVILESCFPYSPPWLSLRDAPWIKPTDDGKITFKLEPLQRIEGRTIYCLEHGVPDVSQRMHFVFSLLDVFQRHNFNSDDSLLYGVEQQFQQDGLNLAGLADRPLVAPAENEVQLFSELGFLSPLVERDESWLSSSNAERFYESLPAPTGKTFRRIYVSRSGANVPRLSNELALIDLLVFNGFEIVDDERLTFPQRIALFSNCEFMFGVHGTGLSNAIFMPQGSSLLEILHPRRLWTTNRAISARRGINYGFVVGNDRGDDVARNDFDFTVDIEKVSKSLLRCYTTPPKD